MNSLDSATEKKHINPFQGPGPPDDSVGWNKASHIFSPKAEVALRGTPNEQCAKNLALTLPAPGYPCPGVRTSPGHKNQLETPSIQKTGPSHCSIRPLRVSAADPGEQLTSWITDEDFLLQTSCTIKNRAQTSSIVCSPHAHDVLCGRGMDAKVHSGHIHYNMVVNMHKLVFSFSSLREKKNLALKVVEVIEKLDPPGRFLKRNNKSKNWYVVGRKEVLKKTKQALRENAPRLIALVDSAKEKVLFAGDEYLRLVQEYTEKNIVPTKREKKRTFEDALDQLQRSLEQKSAKKEHETA